MLAFGVFLPWLLGVSSLLGFLFLKDIRLNFLNFVAIPITIGIGAEYAHNVMQRFRIEGGNRCCGYPRCSCGKRDGGRPTLLP
jgi:predicted RND superfamily exporter protein